MEEMLDSLVIQDRVMVLDGPGPWLIGGLAGDGGSGGPRRAERRGEPHAGARRVRVSRLDARAVELVDLDGEALVRCGVRRCRHVLGLGDAIAIGRAQILGASRVAAIPGSHGAPSVRWQGMLATAEASLRQLSHIACAASARAPVFIAGESGTGKELAARAVHLAGPRRGQPFVALNCAALPETLAESELFGVERGAYTGATRTRAGAFAQAHGGTLFLDEVGELPPLLQAKLLRALEAGEVQPVGGARPIQVDVRVVAASWRDLEDEVERGRFRHDLLHRLCVLRVDLLPLRERPEDVLPLVYDMLQRYDALELAPDPVLMDRLRGAPWRGNVREVRNCVQRAVATHEPLALLPKPRREVSLDPGGQRREAELTRELLDTALSRCRGNRRRAASALGVSRSTIYRWMHALGSHAPGTG